MPETNTAEAVAAPEFLWDIERTVGDKTVSLPYSLHVTTKGKSKGKQFPYFDPDTPEKLQVVREFVGQDWEDQKFIAAWRTFNLNLLNANTDKDGNFDETGFKKNVAELSARGETLKELYARLAGFEEQMNKMADMFAALSERAERAAASGNQQEAAATNQDARKAAAEFAKLRSQYLIVCGDIKAKRPQKEEEEEAKAEAGYTGQ